MLWTAGNFLLARRVLTTESEARAKMTCCASEIRIEDPRNHPVETVLALRDALSQGATIIPDPKRRGFYEVHGESVVYYIRVSPVNGSVLLLATWPNEPETALT
jgi:hypothetical protein